MQCWRRGGGDTHPSKFSLFSAKFWLLNIRLLNLTHLRFMYFSIFCCCCLFEFFAYFFAQHIVDWIFVPAKQIAFRKSVLMMMMTTITMTMKTTMAKTTMMKTTMIKTIPTTLKTSVWEQHCTGMRTIFMCNLLHHTFNLKQHAK